MAERPDFEGVLAPHWRTDYSEAPNTRDYYRWVKCRCGWESERSSSLINAPDMHAVWNAHLAAALNAEVDRWLGDEGTREQVAEGLCPPHHRDGMVSMIVGKPAKYGPRVPCLVHRAQATAALAALTASAEQEDVR